MDPGWTDVDPGVSVCQYGVWCTMCTLHSVQSVRCVCVCVCVRVIILNLTGLLGGKIPAWEQVDIPAENQAKFNDCQTAMDYYKIFSTDEWIDYVVEQSQ